MTDAEKKAVVREISGESIEELSDVALSYYLDSAREAILKRLWPLDPSASERNLPSKFDNRQIMIAVDLIQRRGAEGEIAHNETGVSRTYKNAYVPSDLLKDILPYAHIPGVDNTEETS